MKKKEIWLALTKRERKIPMTNKDTARKIFEDFIKGSFGRGVFEYKLDSALSRLKKLLKERLPKKYKKGAVLFYSPNEDRRIGFTDGANNMLSACEKTIEEELK